MDTKELIGNLHSDYENLFADWERGKIDEKLMLAKMVNLSFYLLRTLTDDSTKK